MIWICFLNFLTQTGSIHQKGYILHTSNMEQGMIKTIVCEIKFLFLKCPSTVRSVRNLSRAIE